MTNKKKIILLSCIAVLAVAVVVVLTVRLTYAFMSQNYDTASVTEVTLKSCARISLNGEGGIDLNNTYPMSRNAALNTSPYSFTVTNACEDATNFDIYLATLESNDLAAMYIHYILTEKDTKNIITEGLLNSSMFAIDKFTAEELSQYNNGLGAKIDNIYTLYSSNLIYQESKGYDLYIYLDENATQEYTSNKTFISGIAVKATS